MMVYDEEDSRRIRPQEGAYAIEFALVFIVLFVVLYAILTYGFIFMAQQSLNRATNTGARSLLMWKGFGETSRIDAAMDQINSFAGIGWVSQMAGLGAAGNASAIQASICIRGQTAWQQVDPLGVCPAFDAQPPAGTEEIAPTTDALVVVRYHYQQAPLIPILGTGILQLPVPSVLEAQTQVGLGISYPGQPEAQ